MSNATSDQKYGSLMVSSGLLRLKLWRWLYAAGVKNPKDLPKRRRKMLRRRRSFVVGLMVWAKPTFNAVYRGLNLKLHPHENSCDRMIAMEGRHGEDDELSIIENQLRGKDVFVDIGANIGLYSLLASTVMSDDAKILAFEPSPTTSALLRSNIDLNEAADRVEVIMAAVGPETSTLTLARNTRHNAGTASLVASTKNDPNPISVKVTPLTQEIVERGLTKIDVIKIDVEGFEDQALLPFFRTASPDLWPEYLLTEVRHSNVWQEDLEAELKERGYVVAFENAHNRHFLREASRG